MPIGQLEEPTPPPPVGGVGVGRGDVTGGFGVEGELPQERAKREASPRAATAAKGIRLPESVIDASFPNTPIPGGPKQNSTSLTPGRQAFSGGATSFDSTVTEATADASVRPQ
jgi:hypothetical protein